jgi:hypothetical protein
MADNPLFLANSRERFRPSIFFSYVTLVFLIGFLIIVNATTKEQYFYYTDYDKYTYNNYNGASYPQYEQQKVLIPAPHNIILGIAIMQHVLLLFFAVISVYKIAGREKINGTLDFHRSSPYPRWKQAFGLLIGATSVEWVMFGLTAVAQIFIALIFKIDLLILANFYTGLIMTALLFQSCGLLAGLLRNNDKISGHGIGILFGFWIFGQILFINDLSAVYHLSWMPAYNHLKASLLHVDLRHIGRFGYNHAQNYLILYSFLSYILPSLLYQAIVQIPIMGLMISASIRRMTHPEHPLFSKAQFALLSFFILFLLFGSNVSNILIGKYAQYYPHYPKNNFLIEQFYFTAVVLGILGALAVTPTKSLFTKGWRRCHKLQAKSIRPDDDTSTNFSWLTTYAFITLIMFTFNIYIVKTPPITAILIYLMTISHIVFFATAYEFFQLSRWGKKKIIFGTAIIILWVLLPTLGNLLKSAGILKYLQIITTSFSPFMGGISFCQDKLGIACGTEHGNFIIAVATVFVLALVSTLMLISRHRKLFREIHNDH